MDKIDQQREIKQNYLKKEILDRDFSPDEFMEYCETIKGAEIDAYTLEELEKIVSDFILSKKSNPDEITVPESFVETPAVSKIPEEISKKQSNRANNSAYSISAVKMNENGLSLEDIILVKLAAIETVTGGMLSTSKYFFPVHSMPFNCTVKRQLDDFTWLRQVLWNNFPGIYLPPPPPKRFRSSPDSQPKQRYFLERFINCMVRNPLLRRSIYLHDFLLEIDYKKFQDLKKKSSKDKRQNKLEDYWTLDGTIICDPFNDESEKVAITEYLNVTESMKKKIKRQSDTLILALKDISTQILDISKSYEILENLQNFVPEISGTKPVYESLKNSFIFWANHEIQTAGLLQEYFNMFFKYGYTEISPLKDLFKDRDQKLEIYEKTASKLMIKKEKLWISGDLNKWGLSNEDMWNANVLKNDKAATISKMLYKETADVEKIKDEYAYLNFQARAEVRRFLLDNQLIENLHFTEFARSMCSHTTKIHVNWGELVASLSQIRSENIPSRSFISKTHKSE